MTSDTRLVNSRYTIQGAYAAEDVQFKAVKKRLSDNRETLGSSSSFVSFAQLFPTCWRMSLPALSLSAMQASSSRRQERRWFPAVAIHRLGVVEIAPSPHHCFCTAHPCAQSVKNHFATVSKLGHFHSLHDNPNV